MLIAVVVAVVFILFLFTSVIKILKEYERGVMFTLGRFTGVKGPWADHRHPGRPADRQNRFARHRV